MSRECAPTVSVVLPMYNAEKYIGEVLDSILEQNFKDFEIVIIDDGSKDESAKIVKRYAKNDKRIRYYAQENRGSGKLGTTLNYGVSLARGELIARADSDDPWMSQKLEKQVNYMRKHPNCVACGGGAEIVDEEGASISTLISPSSDEGIRRAMTLYTPLNHGGVVFRKQAFYKAGEYRDVKYAEDLDLWIRMSKLGEMYNFPEVLFKYRKSERGISLSNEKAQKAAVKKLSKGYWEECRPEYLGRKTIREKMQKNKRLKNGTKLNSTLLEDTLVIALRYAKEGKEPLLGIRQILAVATSSLLGMEKSIKKVCLKYKRIIIYGIFGVLTTVVNLLSYVFFSKTLGVDVVISNIIAWIFAVSFAFVTNKLYVFESQSKDRGVVMREIVSFFGFRIVSGVIEIAAFALFVNVLGMNDMIIKIISLFVVIVLNYVFSKLFVFKK